MKKFSIGLFLLFFTANLVISQKPILYALTRGEISELFGSYHSTISKFDVNTNSLTSVFDFPSDGLVPVGAMVQGPDNKLYGIKNGTNSEGNGILFSFEPITSTYTKLFDFTGINGSQPTGSLVVIGNEIIGVTQEGGVNGHGVIYSYNIVSSTFTKLYDFRSIDGVGEGDLVVNSGLIYGVKAGSVEFNRGVIFTFNLSSLAFNKIHEFNSLERGWYPVGGPILINGKLYGVTRLGGNGAGFRRPPPGVLYSLDLNTSEFSVLHNFGFSRGGEYGDNVASPSGGLILSNDNKLYGLTFDGGLPLTFGSGSYAFDPSNSIFSFDLFYLGIDSYPFGKLLQASDNNIYGTTLGNVIGNPGHIFKLPNVDEPLSGFTGLNGGFPVGGLVEFINCVNNPVTAMIPDTKAINSGVENNTVYTGYAPASSITLTAHGSGGTGSYSYQWSNGSTTQSIKVSPTENTTYTVTVKDSRGCTNTVGKEIKVVDVRCGNKNDKVMVCKVHGNKSKENVLCISPSAIAAHLAGGASLGNCGNNVVAIEQATFQIGATPNPTSSSFTLSITTKKINEKIQLTIYNAMGHIMEARKINGSQTLQLGSSYKADIYYIEAIQGKEKVSVKVIKNK